LNYHHGCHELTAAAVCNRSEDASIITNRNSTLIAAGLLAFGVAVIPAGASASTDAGLLLAQGEQQPAQTGQPTPQQRVAMLKQWLSASQAQIRGYQWIETTVIAKGGEEKSRKQNTCYYGVDGQLQKVPVASDAAPESGPRGPLRKKIVANKKAEVTAYMQSAVALVHEYVPPDPARIQQSVNAGKMSANMVQAGQVVRLDFKDYLKPGDVLSVNLELPTNRLLGISVSSYLDSAEDPVQLDVGMGVLPDGTIYTAKSTLQAPARELTVTVENAGYRHGGG